MIMQNEHQVRQVQLESWEVGGELLDILSRGLYSDAKDCLREYVQNGVDAGAKHIVITVDGPLVVISDDGQGMNYDTIRAARRFGMSDKSPKEMVGYRGIGIYSAFGICEQMTITSHQAGMSDLVGWKFQFGKMRRLLEEDKASEVRQGVGLPDLLHQYTELFVESYSGNPDDHFTVVEIDGISEEYRAQLNNAAGVNDYLLNAIPITFSSEGYGSAVNEWLTEHVGLNPVRISLRVADQSEFDVLPPVAGEVFKPESDWIRAPDGTDLAFVWYALSTNGRQLPSHNGGSVSGFLMKVKGFTLGDRLTLKQLWPAVGGRTLYHHYTGEVHIVDSANLYPNAARDDLESSPDKQLFTKQASDFFQPLSRKARVIQAKARATRLLDGLDNAIEGLKTRENAPDSDLYNVYRESVNYLASLDSVQEEITKHIKQPRGRPQLQFDKDQQASLDTVLTQLTESTKEVRALVSSVQRRTNRAATRPHPSPSQPPPQGVLLTNALASIRDMAQTSSDPRFREAVNAFEPLVRLQAIPRAIGVLDELKATGAYLGASVEASRKELRSSIGWSPLAPVSLEEALGQLGLALETEREETLIRAIDRALVTGLGGRGDRYETVLTAIAESVADEMGS